jgi:Tol biopolymer transport system component
VNSPGLDFTPALSPDGSSLYFASVRPGGFGATDLYVARRTADGDWESPVNLGPVVNGSGPDGAPFISRDGHHLYFNSARAGGFGANDIWVSSRSDPADDFGWGPPVNLGAMVNGSGFDAGPALVFPEFYFTSDAGSGGSLDVYVSRADGGEFGPAMLASELTSDGNDLRPTLRFDGREVFLSSDRAGSLGGSQDIFVARRESRWSSWTEPTGLGSVVNSVYGEQQPGISADGLTLLFASDRPGGSGGLDLWVTTRKWLHR